PYKEIAETLGMTTKGVEYHIAQALKKLHVNLKDYIPLLVFLSYMN
ncbi:RNA polymerase sigma-70 factor, partial [Parabacteroides merdae]|nr:RNA polymerase sigma-70 factor [Parabacteroides merdae]